VFIREGINQKFNGKKIKIKNELVQFKDKLKIVDGSKTENRLVIIFNFLKILS
jgi:hypothetical protein